jgi:hypothetical protein
MQKKWNWKTTLFGGLFAATTGLSTSGALPEEARGLAGLLAALSGTLAAFFARDKDVTSEGTEAPK